MGNMENNVDLIACLPPFLADYKEIGEILRAEEPELSLFWDKAGKVLYNQFITTADEKGIGDYERLLSLMPESSDSLERRRARVMSKWLAKLPYTYKALIERLAALCGNDFSLNCDFERYSMTALVHFRKYSDFLQVKGLFGEMLPANIRWVITNSVSVPTESGAMAYCGAAVWRKRRRISVNVQR